MRVLIDADMIAHEVGHLRHNEKDENGDDIIDEETGRPVKGDLFDPEFVADIGKGRLLSIVMGAEAGGWTGFLTRGRHYRHKLATILPYKGNREGQDRNNVDHVKEALHRDLGAEWCTDREADDAMATEQWQDLVDVGSEFGWEDSTLRRHAGVVIASRDKDLDTVPGWKFKWWLKGAKDAEGNEIPEDIRSAEKGEAYWVTVTQAFRNFYTQMLTGDSADNIKGLFGIGPKSAWVKQLNDIEEEDEMAEHVLEKYNKHFGPHYGRKFFEETGQLLHMQRRRDDRWEAPDSRDEDYWIL